MTEWLFDHLAVRPLALAVFVASGAVLLSLQWGVVGSMQAPAVGTATAVLHPAHVDAIAVEVHVTAGQHVEVGAPLVSLQARGLQRELQVLDVEIVRMERRAVLESMQVAEAYEEHASTLTREVQRAQKELDEALAEQTARRARARAARTHQEEVKARLEAHTARRETLDDARWLQALEDAEAERARRMVGAAQAALDALSQQSADSAPQAPTTTASAAYYEAELRVLRLRRRLVSEDLDALTVRAIVAGRVAEVVPQGAALPPGASAASVMPDEAAELVAYLPPETSPTQLFVGARVAVTDSGGSCRGDALVIRIAPNVVAAPGQIATMFRQPVYGREVTVSLPSGCQLDIGQLVSVEIDRGRP